MVELRSRADAVTFFQSLEHLTRPEETLRQAHELLRPGDMVVIETWDLDSRVACLFGHHWQQVTPPDRRVSVQSPNPRFAARAQRLQCASVPCSVR